MADNELEQTHTLTQTAMPSIGPDFPPDPDSKPIGRCYAEQMEAKAAVMALRAAQQRVRETVSAFGDCRARAAASAGDFAAANQSDFDMITAGLFDMMTAQLTDLENLINRECGNCLTDDTDKQTDITE
jgi:hypothetical protein